MEETRYQVFVSSTYSDLKPEREKALQAILMLQAFPSGMELFPAADDEQFEFIKREISSSDYYIVILAGKYGSVDEDGVSFTEREYDFARNAGKPILAFLAKDLKQLVGDKLEDSEIAKKKVADFHAKAKKSKLVRFFSNPDELKAEILHSLNMQFRLKPMKGWIRAGQTPRPALELINELQKKLLESEQELREFRRLAEDPRNRLASGSEKATWDIAPSQIGLGGEANAKQQFELSATWDEWLIAIFNTGTATVRLAHVRKAVAAMIVVRVPDDWMPTETKQTLIRDLGYRSDGPTWEALDHIIDDIYRQFTGLGLIVELSEVLPYTDIFSGQQKNEVARLWKLTEAGHIQVALISGRLKSLPAGAAHLG